MIGLHTLLLLSVGITVAAAWEPDCNNCRYYNGIGFVRDDDYCLVYYMCIKNTYAPGEYTWYTMCCPNGQTFDREHLTCTYDVGQYGSCNETHDKCPIQSTTTIVPCPYSPVAYEPSQYYVNHTGDIMNCSSCGEVWSQDDCTCVFGPDMTEPCDKILHFEFDDTYDSDSCCNFAKGVPYHDPLIVNSTLCLDGATQFLSIGFLNNWFAWNPIASTWSLCVSFFPSVANQNAGIFSANCYYDYEGSVAEIYLENGILSFVLGNDDFETNMSPPQGEWTDICITFDHGVYEVFYNGNLKGSYEYSGEMPINGNLNGSYESSGEMPINSHSAATLGYVDHIGNFNGYIDNLCFWTSVADVNGFPSHVNSNRRG